MRGAKPHSFTNIQPSVTEPNPSPQAFPERPRKRKKPKSVRVHAPNARYQLRYWPTWMLVGIAWLIARLPISWVSALGRAAGRAVYIAARSRRHITHTNLRLAFPEKSSEERHAMAKEIFRQVGMGALELMIPWLNPKKDISRYFEIQGQEHLDAALADGKGVIIVGAHWTVMDLISQPLSETGPIDVMYRFNKNPVWEWLQVYGRASFFDGVIEREDTRQTLRRLKQGRAIWYAADQDYGAKHSVLAPFFGIDAATIVATSRFARLGKANVLLMRQTRVAKAPGWRIEFFPPLDGFPSGDDVADATRLNGLLEDLIREVPTQYLWLHKRFKTRPPGEPDLYK